MNRMNLFRGSVFTLFCCIVIPTAAAQQSAMQSPLSGLSGICVFEPSVQSQVAIEDSFRTKIKRLIETEFRKDGINVLTGEEWSQSRERARLEVHVTIDEYHKGGVVYSIDMRLIQQVLLLRDSSVKIEAATWYYGPIIGQTYIEDRPYPEFGIEEVIKEGTIDFINSYFYANPKK